MKSFSAPFVFFLLNIRHLLLDFCQTLAAFTHRSFHVLPRLRVLPPHPLPPAAVRRAAVGRADADAARVPRLAGRQDRPHALGQGGQPGAGPAAEAAAAHAGAQGHRADHPRERLVQTQAPGGR